jgi:hypothetical protein
VTALSAIDADGMNEAMAIYLPVMALRPGEPIGELPRSALPDLGGAAEQLRQIATRVAQRTAPDPGQLAAIARADELAAESDAAYLAGNIDLAADRLREAIALLEVARGPSDPSLVELLHRLKLVMRVGGIESGVMSILERIASILAEAYGAIHPLTIRALAEIYWQERREYGPAGGRETATRIERDAAAILGEAHPAARFIRDIIAAAREAIPAGAEPDPEPLSVRRERFLTQPSALADELLADLAATPWTTTHHAYGRAIDTPRHLRLLLADDERLRDDSLNLLAESLLHEESLYPATAPAIKVIRRLVGDARVPGRPRLIHFLGLVAKVTGKVDGPHAGEVRDALADLPALLRYLASSDTDPAVVEAASEVSAPGLAD